MPKHRKPGKPSTVYTYTPPSRRVLLIRSAATFLGMTFRGRPGTGTPAR